MIHDCDEGKISCENGFVSSLREWYGAVPRCISLSAVVLLVMLGAAPEPPDGMVRVKLNQVTPSVFLSETSEIALTAFLEVESVQRVVARGMEFSLIISNEGQTAVQFTDLTTKSDDIFDHLINVRLTNEEGVAVELPQPPSVVQACTTDPEEFRARWRLRRQVERIAEADKARGESVKTPSDADDGVVTLAPGEQYRLSYRIKHILAEPKEYEARKTAFSRGEARAEPGEMERPAISPISLGRYGLSVYARVPGRVGEKEFRRYFELQEPVSVRLGQE